MGKKRSKLRTRKERIEKLLAAKQTDKLREFFKGMHPADIAEVIAELDAEHQAEIFDLFHPKRAGKVLDEMDEESYKDVLEVLQETNLISILNELPPDEGADVVAELEPAKASKVLQRMKKERSQRVKELLKYPPDTAGGIMTSEVMKLNAKMTVEEATDKCRSEFYAEASPYVFVVDDTEKLVGVVRIRDLLFSPDATVISTIMNPDVISVDVNMDQEEIGNMFRKYDLIALPVTDDKKRLLGIITVDDVLEVIEEENSEDIYKLAGTSEREPFTEPLYKKALERLPWLSVVLVGELICSRIIKGFEGTLEQIVAIAFFIPVVISMAGSTAIQSSTIITRGLAVGEVKGKDLLYNLFREVRVGILLGLTYGIISGFFAYIITHTIKLGLTIAISMVVAIFFASINGVLIPIVCSRLGKDPAVVSGPFITTFNDILGAILSTATSQILNK